MMSWFRWLLRPTPNYSEMTMLQYRERVKDIAAAYLVKKPIEIALEGDRTLGAAGAGALRIPEHGSTPWIVAREHLRKAKLGLLDPPEGYYEMNFPGSKPPRDPYAWRDTSELDR